MNTSWIRARQTKFAAYTTIYILVVFGILGVVNFLAQRYDKSYDTTSSKQYTLSDQTIQLAKNLKQDVSITFWDQPSRFQAAHDLLDRYQTLSPRINVRYLDAEKNRTQAIAAGVKALGTIQIQTGNKLQEAKALTEEEVTGALVRALKNGERMACFTLGSGEHSLEDQDRNGYSQVKSLLESNNYKTQTLRLLQDPNIPTDCLIVVAAGPTRDYLEPEVSALKKFVQDGGRALFFLDSPLKFASQEVDDNDALVKVLTAWGVTPAKDLVLDTSGIGQVFGLGPEVPLITSYGSHAIVRPLRDTPSAIPLARSLAIKNGAQTTVETLFETSENSFATSDLKSARIEKKASDKDGPFVLGAAGQFTGESKGQFVVVGSSSWASNSFLRVNGNRDLFMNIMNWLSSDEDLISIRPKEPEDRRITLTRSQILLVFYSSVLAIPLLIVAAGLSVWWKRR